MPMRSFAPWPALLALLWLVGAASLAPATIQSRGSFDVLVLGAATGDPVVGAQVRYEREPGVFIDGRTDTRGRLRLRSPEVPARVEVSHGGLTRSVAVEVGREERLVIELLPPLALELRLLDAAGRPAADWEARLVGREEGDPLATNRRVFTARTDASGVARWTDPDGRLEGRDLRTLVWSIEVPAIAVEATALVIDLRAGPSARHGLRLPPLGSLDLTLTRADGEPAVGGRVRLVPVGLGRAEAPTAEVGEGGRVHFEHLGVGLSFDVFYEGPDGEERGPRLAGPPGQGRAARHAWTLPGPPPRLVLKLAAAGAEPGAQPRALAEGTRVSARAAWHGGAHRFDELQVASDGRLTVSFPPEARDAAHGRIEIEQTAPGRRQRLGDVALGTLTSGSLGEAELVLAEPPLAARGRVLGRDDRAVEGAWVAAERWRASAAGARPPKLAVPTDRSGRFELGLPAGAAQGGDRLTLWVEAPGHVARSFQVDPGAEGLVLRLEPAVPMAGSLRLQANAPDRLLVRAILPDGRHFETPLGRPGPEEEYDTPRVFAFPGLPPGPVELWVHQEGFGDLLEIGSLELVRGPATTLEPIEVRGFLARYPLEVRQPGGREETFFVRLAGHGRWGEREGPHTSIWSRRGSLDLELAAPGALTRTLRLGPGGDAVELEPAVEVEIAWAAGFDPSSLPHGLGLRLVPAAGQPHRAPAPLLAMPAAGERTLVSVDFAGEAQIEWDLSAGDLRPPVRWAGPRVRLEGARVELSLAPEPGPLADALRRFQGAGR